MKTNVLLILAVFLNISNAFTQKQKTIVANFELDRSIIIKDFSDTVTISIPYFVIQTELDSQAVYRISFSIDLLKSTFGSISIETPSIELDTDEISNLSLYRDSVKLKIPKIEIGKIEIFEIQMEYNDLDESFTRTHQIICSSMNKSTENITAQFKTDTNSVGDLYLTSLENIPYYSSESKKNAKKKNETLIQNSVCLSERRFYKNFAEKAKHSEIGNVRFVVSDGKLIKLAVFIGDDVKEGVYQNSGPISLTNMNKIKFYRLDYYGPNSNLRNTYIVIGDFINYLQLRQRNLIPSDSIFMLNKDSFSTKLKSEHNPQNIISGRIYTDAKGLSGQNNGLIQTDIKARFFGNTTAISRTNATLFQFASVGLNYSKFDSEYDTLQMPSLINRSGSEILNLIQNSNASVKVELDLFRYSRVHDGFLSIGHNLYSTKVWSKNDSSFSRVFTPSFYLNLGGTLYVGNYMKAHFCFPVSMVYFADQPFREYSKKFDLVFSPEIELEFNLLNKQDFNKIQDVTSIFTRFRFFDTPSYSENNFWQIQLGLQVPLNKIFTN
jgi:hypothetical protein